MEPSSGSRQFLYVQPETDDTVLVARAQTGDRNAFAELYERHHVAIFRFALHMTGAPASAEDVVQDVFVAFMHAVGRFEANRSVRAYLYGIARHIAGRRSRRERFWVAFDASRHDAVTAPPSVVDDLERRDDLLQLRHALLALPRKQREVIVLCDVEQVSYEEAAASIGCAVGTIRSRLHRARTALASALKRADRGAGPSSRRTAGWVL